MEGWAESAVRANRRHTAQRIAELAWNASRTRPEEKTRSEDRVAFSVLHASCSGQTMEELIGMGRGGEEERRRRVLEAMTARCGLDGAKLIAEARRVRDEDELMGREFGAQLMAAALEPLCRGANRLMSSGEAEGAEFFGEGEHMPDVVSEREAERVLCVGRTVATLRRMGEDVSSGEEKENESRTLQETLARADRLYKSECSRLVSIVLGKRRGLLVARELRNSFGSLPSEETVEWPVSELLATPKIRASYQAVGLFIASLQHSLHALSRMRLEKKTDANVLRFRQKALHVVSALLGSMVALRLNHDVSWDALEPMLVESPDFEHLARTHSEYVQKLSDVCLQNDALKPLRKAVETMLRCTDAFVEGGVAAADEAQFDASLAMLRRLIGGILEQRKIPHLKGFLTALEFGSDEK